jgi:hypothetical protein
MARRQNVQDPTWRAEAEAFIRLYMAPTRRDRYLARPELLGENIAHDLEGHLDARRAVAIGHLVHTTRTLIEVISAALGDFDGGYCLVAGPWCPGGWREQRDVPISELLADELWWTSDVLMSFNRGAAACFSAEASTDPRRALLFANEVQRARAAGALESLARSKPRGRTRR